MGSILGHLFLETPVCFHQGTAAVREKYERSLEQETWCLIITIINIIIIIIISNIRINIFSFIIILLLLLFGILL